MTNILTFETDQLWLAEISLILETAGFKYLEVTQLHQVFHTLRTGNVDLLLLGGDWSLTTMAQLYSQIVDDSAFSRLPIGVLTSLDIRDDLPLREKDQILDPELLERDLLKGVVMLLVDYAHPIPNASQRLTQFHKVRHQLQQRFKDQTDKSLRATHKKYSRLINRLLP